MTFLLNLISTNGSKSSLEKRFLFATRLFVDEIIPLNSTVTTVSSVGGNEVANFWNTSNLTTQIIVPTNGLDNSIIGGTIQLLAKVTEGNAFSAIGTVLNGGLIDVTGAEVGANVPLTADKAAYESLNNYPLDTDADGLIDSPDGLLIYHTVFLFL